MRETGSDQPFFPALYPRIYRPQWLRTSMLMLMGFLLIAIGVFFIFGEIKRADALNYYVVMTALGIAIFGGWVLMRTRQMKVVLTPVALEATGFFTHRKIRRDEIALYDLVEYVYPRSYFRQRSTRIITYLEIEFKALGYKKIRINIENITPMDDAFWRWFETL